LKEIEKSLVALRVLAVELEAGSADSVVCETGFTLVLKSVGQRGTYARMACKA
jgi:hypothetical protein